jgi:hypothetical protein
VPVLGPYSRLRAAAQCLLELGEPEFVVVLDEWPETDDEESSFIVAEDPELVLMAVDLYPGGEPQRGGVRRC